MEIYKMHHVHLENNMHSVFVGTLWSLLILKTIAGLLVIPLNWPECRDMCCGSWGTSFPILWKDPSVLQVMYLPQGLLWESKIDPGIISYHLTLFFCSWWSPMEGKHRVSHNQDFQWHIGAWGLPRWLSSKESFCKAGDKGDKGLIPGSGRSPGRELDNPFQYSCWDNPMDRGAWWTTDYGVAKSGTWLNAHLSLRQKEKSVILMII